MPVFAPSDENIRNILAGMSVKQVFIGGQIYFGQEDAIGSLSFIESQIAVVNQFASQIFINGANIALGDTIIIITRADSATPLSASLPSGNPVVLLASRTNGLNDTLTLWKYQAGAQEAGANTLMALDAPVQLYADVIVVRGKSLPNAYNTSNVLNNANLTVPVTGIPTNKGDSLLIAGFNGTGSTPTSITSTACTLPISGSLGTPKTGITSFVCIVKQEDLVDATITQNPSGTGQMIIASWLN